MQQYRPGRFQLLPPVVKNLLIINGLFYLATFALNRFDISLVQILGLRYFGSDLFKPYQLISYMFMHSDQTITHILFNMFALWMFGYAIENFWGGKRFLIYYFVTGFGAALLHYGVYYIEIRAIMNPINDYLFNPDSMEYKERAAAVLRNFTIPPITPENINIGIVESIRSSFLDKPVVVGASGAVFGILLAFGMMFPNTVIYLYFAIPIKAKWFVILYGALELYFGFSNMGRGNIAHFAHLGGMIFGFILLKYWKVKRLN